jgi:hypothetical protein
MSYAPHHVNVSTMSGASQPDLNDRLDNVVRWCLRYENPKYLLHPYLNIYTLPADTEHQRVYDIILLDITI